ncbi:MAG: hypothetical protein MJZ25_14615 [Fibrobacter sp.]|nr:hypothetical protein [Fibrobacter sp.]
MKKSIIALMLLAACLFSGCTVVKPNYAFPNQSVLTEPMKVKKMTPVSYEYDIAHYGCSEIKFLKKFVGKVTTNDQGEKIRVDNIVDIHVNQYSRQKNFFYFTGAPKYKCSFWGYAVEYEHQ